MTLLQYLPYVYRFLAAALIITAIVLFRDKLFLSLLPFLIAFVLAGLIEPAVRYLNDKMRLTRSVAVTIVLMGVLIIGGYLGTRIVFIVYDEVNLMAQQATTLQRQATSLIGDLLDRLEAATEDEIIPAVVTDAIEDTVDSLSAAATAFLKDKIAPAFASALGSVPQFLLITVITMIATYFLSRDRNQVSESLLLLAPRRWRLTAKVTQERIVDDLVHFIKGQFIIFIVITALAAVGLYLMQVQFWLTIAIVIGILDAIPVIGPGIVMGPWAAANLLMGDTAMAFYIVLLYVAIFAIQQVMQAKILGESIGIHPLLMLLAIYGGIVIFGGYGLIIGPMLVIIGRALNNSGLISWPRRDDEDETVGEA